MDPVERVVQMKFDGQLHQIDSNTLISSLLGFSEVVKQVNAELNPGSIIEIKINAFGKGSFVAEIVAIALETAPILPYVSATKDLFDVIKGIYDLRRFLKGNKGKVLKEEGNKITIQDNHGKIIVADHVTYQIYNSNPTIQKAITTQFASLQEDPSVEGYHLVDRDSGKEILTADRIEFKDMAVLKDDTDKKNEQVIAELTISKLIFENNQTRKWEFYFKGNRISANVIDTEFFKQIDRGERFAKGDRLKVELNIQKIFDESVNVYVIESYTVVKILEHIRRPDEKSLFDSKEGEDN